MPKTHDRDFFYKYTTSNVAMNILITRQVRWSSPLVFNDPFDTQYGLHFDCEPADITDALFHEFDRLVFDPNEPQIDPTHPLSPLIKMCRMVRPRLTREDLRRDYSQAVEEGAQAVQRELQRINQMWQDFLQLVRVFCVSEVEDDLLMWSHYADHHRGAVLKIKCLPERDTALLAARPIIYRAEMPVMATKDQLVKSGTGQAEWDYRHVFEDLAFSKSEHWAYEKEWRCFTWRLVSDDPPYFLNPIFPAEIEAVYFGCRMTAEDREVILKLLVGDLRHVAVYEMLQSKTRFELVPEQIR